MRLINASTMRLETFNNESTIPPYTILSHTWGDSEVTFQDFSSLVTSERRSHVLSSAGYYKIAKTCEQALSEGIAYAWVDTCCIDKTSSAELSESINSMFRWYKNAQACYAYLDDIDASDTIGCRHIDFVSKDRTSHDTNIDMLDGDGLAKARWFTRGWTLQELIAPTEVAFYVKGWEYVGHKSTMKGKLARITGIDARSLTRYRPNVSVAERMSWAAQRETSKGEDMAYCLLGLFDVSMPLLYGEGGEKAFVRLQEEIMKDSDDQSLFAWHSVERPQSQEHDERPRLMTLGVDPIVSIFASHPRVFRDSTSSRIRPSYFDRGPYALTNIGVRMRIPTLLLDRSRSWYLLVLNCTFKDNLGLQVGLAVKKLPGDAVTRFVRLDSVGLFRLGRRYTLKEKRVEALEVYLCKNISWLQSADGRAVKQLDVPHAREFLLLTEEETEVWEKRWASADVQPDNVSLPGSVTKLMSRLRGVGEALNTD